MSILTSLRASASALTAQRMRMNAIANNVANVETTRTPEGGPYRRQQVVFTPRAGGMPFLQLVRAGLGNVGGRAPDWIGGSGGVQVAQVIEDQAPGRLVHQPDHPDANADGYVEYPNVDLVTEMVDMLSATRSYEANVTVLSSAKSMAMRALDIMKA